MTDIEDVPMEAGVVVDEPVAAPPSRPATVEGSMQQAVSMFNASTRPDAPVIRKPSPGTLTLLYGLRDGDDRHVEAEVRELTGADEEAIAKLDSRKAGNLFFAQVEDLILRRTVTRIGNVDIQKHPDKLGQLLIGDRGLLFSEVLIATYGEEKEYEEIVCPHCEALNDILVSLRGLLDVKGMQVDEPEIDIEVGGKNGKRVVRFRYPTGDDQMQVFQTKRDATEPEVNTFMLARCLLSDVGRDNQEFVRQLSIPDRRKIVKALAAAPSVTFKEVSVPCTSCHESIPFAFGWADLLFGT